MGTTLKQIAQNQASKEYTMNEGLNAVSPAGKFGRKNTDNAGLTFYYYGGRYADTSGAGIDISDGSLTMTASTTNYIEYNPNSKTVVSNTTGYTTGNIPLFRVPTNATQITTASVSDDRIQILLPTGVSPSIGASSSIGFGDIAVSNPSVGASPGATLFTVKGGKNWTTGKGIISTTEATVADYSSTSNFTYLNANSTYYVFFNLVTNSFATTLSSNAISVTGNAKLMWVIVTGATQITTVTDYRACNYYIKNRTIMNATQLYAGPRSDDLNMSLYYYQNQIADATVMTAVSSQYPMFIRPYTCLLCLTAEKGYAVGDEADYVTGDGTIWGKPLKMGRNGTVSVYQGAQTKIWNNSTNAWETPTVANWALICKLTLEYH